jgi:hypothetical protein
MTHIPLPQYTYAFISPRTHQAKIVLGLPLSPTVPLLKSTPHALVAPPGPVSDVADQALAIYLYRLHRRQEVDDLTIKALLNHYDGRPVAIYTRLDVEYLSKILQGYADWLWSLPGTIPKPEGHRDRSRDGTGTLS